MSRAEWFRRSNLLAIDVCDTEPCKNLALNDSDNSKGGCWFSDIAPRNSLVRLLVAGDVGPALEGGIRTRLAVDVAVLSLAVSLNSKLVVARLSVFGTVAGEVLDRPEFAFDGSGLGERDDEDERE
ncbi:hypothetical protein HG531_012163 [Fusarium graminearum]|nr:hypothetical protein HG531_012163 [Fusarium graminearum]